MCGLVGVAGDIRQSDLNAFNQLLIADTFRGAHSTGVAGVGLNKEVEPDLLKAPMPAWDFLEMLSDVKSVINISQHVLMGHNRHATKGAVNRRNAHPFFVEDNLVGCHNGTLNAFETKKFIDDFDSYGTDSEAALASFVKRGTRETLSNIIGAWAFVWFDYRDNRLYFTRNKERPLYIAIDQTENKKVYWASELEMLKWVLGRNHLITKDMKFLDVGVGQIVSFELPSKLSEPLGKMNVGKYTPKELRATTTNHYESGKWGPGKPRGTTESKTSTSSHSGTHSTKAESKTTTQEKSDIVDLARFRQVEVLKRILKPEHWNGDPSDWVPLDHFGEIIDKKEDLEIYTRGKTCACCGAKISPTERFRAFAPNTVTCEDCSENDDTLAEMLYEGGVVA